MTASQFNVWRKSLKMTQKRVASALGLKSRIMHCYEKGEQNGEQFESLKAVMLVFYALILGVGSYSGPEPDKKQIEANHLGLADLFSF